MLLWNSACLWRTYHWSAGAVAERLSASVGARLGRPDWAPLRYSRIAWWDLRRVTASVGEYAWTFSKTNTCTGICSLPSEYVGSARKKEHWQKCWSLQKYPSKYPPLPPITTVAPLPGGWALPLEFRPRYGYPLVRTILKKKQNKKKPQVEQ